MRRGQRRGAAAVEFAVVAPMVFLVLFAIFEYGRYFMVRHLMDSAAREGVRYAVVNSTSGTPALVTNIVNARTAPIQNAFVNGSYSVDVYWLDAAASNTKKYPFNDATFGSMMGVTVSATFKPMMPRLLYMSTTFPVRSSCYMLSEAN
jgi:Flp pilus assembly protein TadG